MQSGRYLAPRDGTVVTVRNGSPQGKPRKPWRYQSGRERASAIVAATPLPAPPPGRHPGDPDGEICDLCRIIVHLIEETAGPSGHPVSHGTWPATAPGLASGTRERRLSVRAVFAFCACPDHKVPLTGGPPRDCGADSAAARAGWPVLQPERARGRTCTRAGEGSDVSRRPCFRRSAETPAAHRSRPGS